MFERGARWRFWRSGYAHRLVPTFAVPTLQDKLWFRRFRDEELLAPVLRIGTVHLKCFGHSGKETPIHEMSDVLMKLPFFCVDPDIAKKAAGSREGGRGSSGDSE
jgi:hypothetical protein